MAGVTLPDLRCFSYPGTLGPSGISSSTFFFLPFVLPFFLALSTAFSATLSHCFFLSLSFVLSLFPKLSACNSLPSCLHSLTPVHDQFLGLGF